MSRIDRIFTIIGFLAAFFVVGTVWVALAGNAGPLEMLFVILVTIPLGLWLSRRIRRFAHGTRGKPRKA